MKKAGLLILLLHLLICLQAQQPFFQQYTLNDGLPSMEVYSVFEDSKGLMWFCTDAGVSRFDGYSFKNFTSDQGLPDNTVFGMAEDTKGRLWFYSISGQLCYFENDTIYSIGANKAILSALGSALICSITITKGDTLYCGILNGNGYLRIAPPYKEANVEWINLPETTAFYVIDLDKAGIIYGCQLSNQNDKNSKNRSNVSFFSRRKSLYTILLPDTLNHIKITAIRTQKGSYQLMTCEVTASVENGKMTNCIFESGSAMYLSLDRDGGHWQGRYQRGITSKNTLEITPDFLRPATVTCVYKDTEAGLWFATLERGVYYIPSLNYSNKIENSEQRIVTAITRLDSSYLAIGFSNNELMYLNPESKNEQSTIAEIDWPTPIRSLYNIGNDTLLVGGNFAGYITGNVSDPKNHFLFSLTKNVYLYSFASYKGKHFAINNSVLYDLNLRNCSVNEICATPARFTTIFFDPSGTLWGGAINGLWKFNNKDGWEYYGNKYPLLANRIDNITADKDGALWLATKGAGVILFKNNETRQFTTAQGLSSMICHSVVIDNSGTIWVATNNGISSIEHEGAKWKISRLGKDSGLPQKYVITVIPLSGTIWAAGNEGVFSFDAIKAKKHQYPPRLLIEKIDVNDRVYSTLKNNISLQSEENTITFHYVGISYKNPGKLSYSYRMLGLDSIWRSTTNTSVRFFSLPPGSYKFQLISQNNDGIKSIQQQEFAFTILKPIWKTGWFIFSAIACFLLLAAFLIWRRIQKIKTTELLNRRIVASEMSALRAQMNPHFVFNAINSIQHFILRDNATEAHRFLSKFSKLIRNVLDNSRQEIISLERETETIKLYLELEALRFSNSFSYQLIIAPEIVQQTTFIAPMLIQPFIENAIWHGLLHKENGAGELTITIGRKNDLLQIEIDDNGIGRTAAAAITTNTPKKHKSVGIKNTLERI
ncbi:MAG: histidine kinase, partial [Bacteroidia bacterium]